MKIIHTSDWHIGQNFYCHERDEEHRFFFDQLAATLQKECPDALVVSGDIFHNPAPHTSAQKLFVEGVMQLHDASPNTKIVITAGNHDSGSRLDAESELWRRLGISIIGGCRRKADGSFDPSQYFIDVYGKGYILAVPYFHVSNYPAVDNEIQRDERQKEFFNTIISFVPKDDKPLIMMAHLALDGCNTRGHDEMSVGGIQKEPVTELGYGYDYLALGHIHMPQKITDRAYYCGSPIPVSFSEDYDHYVNIVEIDKRGDVPHVRKEKIELRYEVETIPADGASLEDAIKALAAIPDDNKNYVRLHVEQESVIDPDAEDRARKAISGKKCRFCYVYVKHRENIISNDNTIKVVEMSDFTNIKPIDIAKYSFLREIGTELEGPLLEMLQKAISLEQEEE